MAPPGRPPSSAPRTVSRTARGPEAVDVPPEKDSQSPSNKKKSAPSQTEDSFNALLHTQYHGKSLTDPIDTARDKWNLLPAFLKVKGLIKQHIDSYNFFVDFDLKDIVRANSRVVSSVDPHYFVEFLDIRVLMPNRPDEDNDRPSTITPNECRLRDTSYTAPIVVDIKYRKDKTIVRRKNIRIGRMPIMLRSNRCVLSGKPVDQMGRLGECPIDPGGYFIVRGQEKVILVQEQLSKNRVIVESFKGIIQASATSDTHLRKSKTYVIIKKGVMTLKHNIFQEDIPIVVAFRAMGIQTEREMLEIVAGEDHLYQDMFAVNFEDANKLDIHSQQQALEYVGSKIKIMKRPANGAKRNYQSEALGAFKSIIIAHVPVQGIDFKLKALYVAHMARRVIMATHDSSLVDDRDYVGNKRLELAGQMLSILFEDNFKRFTTDFKTRMDKILLKPVRAQPFDVYDHLSMHSSSITQALDRALATGNWSLKRFRMERAGVTHVLSRLSYIAALGMMTRISSQFEKTRKVSGPRALQPSQFGMLCPSDTPEGEACGLVKNLALMTHITTNVEEEPIRRCIATLNIHNVLDRTGGDLYKPGTYIIFVNGTPFATTSYPKTFLRNFRDYRRASLLSKWVSININNHYNAIHIASDEGRVCRPLIIVEKGKSKVTARYLKALLAGKMDFDDFVTRGLVEYLDVNEENDSLIAMYEKDINSHTTHLEIEPFTLLGAVAGLIPFPHHNQSPRNTYQCAMGKQAIGAIGYNQFERIDTLLYLMVYPQRPLVTTRTIELIQYDKLPAGQAATVAVMSYSGYDIEDALVLNKASCDRGFGRCQVFKKATSMLKRYQNGTQDIVNAGAIDYGNPSHQKLGKDGIVDVGFKLEKNDTYMLKQTPTNYSSSGLERSDRSSTLNYIPLHSSYKLPDPCYVDKVMLASNETDSTIIKIQTRQTRRPELGDKFSSRHGQKGVVGLIAEQADMPFDSSGICPDIIMNPHGFPSRMTVGKMLELVAGKAGVLTGKFKYGTAFGGERVQEVGELLLQKGFNYLGKDCLTSGITGEMLPAYVFTGPIYYQKLKHMVQDKMHSRARGPVAMLTRQPTEGRSRDGGLRLGEMERDCLIAYGASQLLIERLMLSSDAHDCDVCEQCGLFGLKGWCVRCNTSEHMYTLTVPYASKLLIQELGAMNVRVGVELEDVFKEERYREGEVGGSDWGKPAKGKGGAAGGGKRRRGGGAATNGA
ncbi:beta and beta-prime subunits of DNA dependent RNA-polymerase [Aulographum hederae CBS 113979]|uniref:DNA-directed RNA polymerase subunit beta n=1 Tax=Aulographum hederae CBS 113979 TaxID=1176131 RepID=A0A6G1HBG6_9PEZI|nr:beta and beta-prime subunits of DNA dependent RNA-polymerase [Aulographum hederae CBS 113979]